MPPKRKPKSSPPRNVSEVLLSGRTTPRIEALYALIVVDQYGNEGIVRRETPIGTLPFISDDYELCTRMLELARETPFSEGEIGVAKFARVADVRTIERPLGPIEPAPDPGPAPTLPEGPA